MRQILLTVLLMVGLGSAVLACPPTYVACPVCGAQAMFLSSQDGPPPQPESSFDRDFRDVSGGSRLDFKTCQECRYTAESSKFGAKRDEEICEWIRNGALGRPWEDERAANFVQADLALQIARLAKSPAEVQVPLCMETVWSTRERRRPFDDELTVGLATYSYRWLGSADWAHLAEPTEALRRLETALRANSDSASRREISILIVQLLWSQGEYEQILDKLPELETLPATLGLKVRAQREREKFYLSMALPQSLAVLSATPPGEEQARQTYLVAELYRRIGQQDDVARQFYHRALADPALDPMIRAWIPEQMALLDAPKVEEEESRPWVPALALVSLLSFGTWLRRRRRRA